MNVCIRHSIGLECMSINDKSGRMDLGGGAYNPVRAETTLQIHSHVLNQARLVSCLLSLDF